MVFGVGPPLGHTSGPTHTRTKQLHVLNLATKARSYPPPTPKDLSVSLMKIAWVTLFTRHRSPEHLHPEQIAFSTALNPDPRPRLTAVTVWHHLALEDRRVSADDLKLAVKLAIAPRGIFMNTPQDDEEMMVRPVAIYNCCMTNTRFAKQ